MNTPIDPAYVEHCERRISELERQVAAEKERADYAWRNTNTIEKARQEETAKRDALTEQVAALTKENDRLKTVPMKYRRMEFNAQLQNQLAAAQAVNERLRDVLSMFKGIGAMQIGNIYMPDSVAEALATPSDTTTLQARLAEEREKIVVWLRNNYQDYSLSGICDAIRSMK